jgi:hypothetical protein
MTNDRMVKKIVRVETDTYKVGRKSKHYMGKRYKRRFNYENK